MFLLRGVAVSLTFFVLLYCLFSAMVVLGWRSLRLLCLSVRGAAALLFAVRILPLVGSALITFAFVVPSFQLLEPRSVDEGMGAMPLALGICAILLIAAGFVRVISAQAKTTRVVSPWLEGARPLAGPFSNAAFQSRSEAPPLILVGFRKPRIMVSESALGLLTPEELNIALKHELAHMESRDNWKKLVFRFCPFPGMARLESAWSQAAELAADDAAVSNQLDAIELASALVKLSRLLPREAAPACTVGFVTGSIRTRVARLLAWDEARKKDEALRRKGSGQSIRPWYAIPSAVVAVLCIVVTYGPALAVTHEVTEWLVR